MPTAREIVINKALAGPELAEVILSDVAKMVAGCCFLTSQMAYTRIAYDLRLTLHLGLESQPVTEEHALSRAAAVDVIALSPGMAALEPFPLTPPAPDAILSATDLHRDITSPNLARVAHGLPIDVATTGQDGHIQDRQIVYPAEYGADQIKEPDFSDVSEEMKKELGL